MPLQEGYYNPIIVEESISRNCQNDIKNQNSDTTNVIANDNHQSVQRTIRNEEIPPIIYTENRIENLHFVAQNRRQNGGQTTIDVETANEYAQTRINEQNREQNAQHTIQRQPPTPNHVEQTIFYDPFEDRRIVISRNDQTSPRPMRIAPSPPINHQDHQINIKELDHNVQSPTERNTTSNRPTELTRPAGHSRNLTHQITQRPSDFATTLREFHGVSPELNSQMPPELNRVTEMQMVRLNPTTYSPLTPDDFTLSPLPVKEYEPPPSYQDVILATQQRNNSSNLKYHNAMTQQPISGFGSTANRQDLIRSNDQQPPLAGTRKILNCQHCNTRVATVVVKQSGCVTHVIAMIFLFLCLFPVTILIYCGGCLKYENHYCPTCSNMIGYRVPMSGRQLVHVSPR